MKKLKIIITILLCLVFVLPLVVSCGKDDSKTNNNNPTAAGDNLDAAEPAEEKDPDMPNLPASDMGGKIFTFLCMGTDGDPWIGDIVREELLGDPINDAAYNRQMKIEQTYNVKLKQVDGGDYDQVVNSYRTSILAADGSYDAAITRCANFISLLTGNYLIDFKELSNIDIDKPYWNKNFYETMSIMGRHYAADGDLSTKRLECAWIMAFNKDIIRENGFESPYDLVKSGQWTYDKMHEMARSAAKDLNGDGKMILEDDMWGLNYTGDTIMGIINGCGVKIAELNSEGIPELTIGSAVNVEKMLRIYTDMRDHTYSIDTLFSEKGGVTGLGDVDIFADKRCLFLACATHNISYNENTNNKQSLRTMDVTFGIIPYPKWDVAQSDYLPHTAGHYHPILTVPQTNSDLDNTGIILEALAYEGMKNISPIFYENLLKTRTTRDEESAEMIDFIFGNLSYDVGNMFNFGEILGTFGYNMSTSLKSNIVSTIEKNEGKWQKAIDNMIAEIEKNS